MDLVCIERRDAATLVRLNRGVTNPLNLSLVKQLTETVAEAREDPSVRGLVLGSANDKFFSIGFDIPELIELNREDFKVFYQGFNRLSLDLYTLPKPTVAAISGHAVAGGCILTLCCDYRFIADGRKLMGLNEVKLGVPVPYPGDSILRHTIESRYAREILGTGEFYNPGELLHMGVTDKVLPLKEVLLKAVEKVQSLGALPDEAFSMIKGNRVEPVAKEILTGLEAREQAFLERWFSAETRERLREAMKKF